MISKNDIIEKAHECGFGDIGFTTADSFDSQRELLQERQKEYEWAFKMGLDLMDWAIGRIGGSKAKKALNDILPGSESLVREEILFALERS